MTATTPHTWTCPSCGRRVPLRAEACHCGMPRERAEQLAAAAQVAASPAPRAARGTSLRQELWSSMSTDVKLLLALGALALVVGFGFLLFGPGPPRYPAVLGYVDPGPPPLPDKAAATRPAFKLPWWK